MTIQDSISIAVGAFIVHTRTPLDTILNSINATEISLFSDSNMNDILLFIIKSVIGASMTLFFTHVPAWIKNRKKKNSTNQNQYPEL